MQQISPQQIPPPGVYTLYRTSLRLFGFLMLLVMGIVQANAQITINTDTLTINGSSTNFNGFSMTAQNVGGIARFTVLGDIVIPNNTTVTITGSRPLSLVA